MQLRTLIQLGFDYAVLGGLIFGFLLIVFLIGYFLIYRKLLKGQKRLSLARIAWWGVFLCYAIVVLGVTILFRWSAVVAQPIYPPFYSYRDAWAHWSEAAWRNIILNFAMFVPLGFLLPIGWEFFRRESHVFLVGFAGSLAIELIQLFTKRGMFEWDDLLGNTVGTLIGYGFYLILAWAGQFFRKHKNFRVLAPSALKTSASKTNDLKVVVIKKGLPRITSPVRLRTVLLAQIPLLVTACVFTVIFTKYARLELGISPDTCIRAYDSRKIKVNSAVLFSTAKTNGMVYQLRVLTPEEATQFGEELFSRLGTHVKANKKNVYENSIVLNSEDEQYVLWVDYKGGTWNFTNYPVLFPQKTEPMPQMESDSGHISAVTGASETEIRDALETLGISLPKDAVFHELVGDWYEPGWYEFKVGSIEADNRVLIGTLSCQYFGKAGFAQASNHISECIPYKEYPLLSEQEAFDELADGQFDFCGKDILNIMVQGCQLTYTVDSKGFYQPTYEFSVTINGEETHIHIPAIR